MCIVHSHRYRYRVLYSYLSTIETTYLLFYFNIQSHLTDGNKNRKIFTITKKNNNRDRIRFYLINHQLFEILRVKKVLTMSVEDQHQHD